MYSEDPVWLVPEELIKKFSDFCFKNSISERRIVRLFDAYLLRGRDNRKSKNIEILQQSFFDLQAHIKYNHLKQVSKNEAKIIQPPYCKKKYMIFYDRSYNWYTITEALDTYSDFLKEEKNFTVEFIGELVNIGLITGKYNLSENCYHILLPSFVDLIKYRDYSVSKILLLPPPPDFPQA